MSTMLEAAMMILFGFSWPISVIKSWRSRTNGSKSLLFLTLIWVAYLCGIIAKILSSDITYVLVFYILNLVMVAADICIYFRNAVLDRRRKPEPALPLTSEKQQNLQSQTGNDSKE